MSRYGSSSSSRSPARNRVQPKKISPMLKWSTGVMRGYLYRRSRASTFGNRVLNGLNTSNTARYEDVREETTPTEQASAAVYYLDFGDTGQGKRCRWNIEFNPVSFSAWSPDQLDPLRVPNYSTASPKLSKSIDFIWNLGGYTFVLLLLAGVRCRSLTTIGSTKHSVAPSPVSS